MASGNRPRLWWCPTGAFSFVPIHAAGSYATFEPQECTSDFVISSYTPTLTALISARASSTPLEPQILLIAQPITKGLNPLPKTAEEIRDVEKVLPPHLLLRIRSDPTKSVAELNQNCSYEDVVKKLPDASIVHLACHGSQERKKPLESGFRLTGQTLTVADLMQLNIPRPFFAFLSACESASGDIDVPDETVHLAASMLFSGFKSVVGTMW